MAGSQIERAFSLVESLTGEPQGLPLQTLAERLDIPKARPTACSPSWCG